MGIARSTYYDVSAEFPAPVHRRGSEGFCVHNGDCGHMTLDG
ncbi:hypothetical protein GGE07_006551, partial [Sinorhizobium terangae]|nr:hypothetical protein [Sinorhizobium terangae]